MPVEAGQTDERTEQRQCVPGLGVEVAIVTTRRAPPSPLTLHTSHFTLHTSHSCLTGTW